ncbi:MAG TPA: bifunctional helix-turn-helix domain-containing protein/methylated-DNA--[protein]-cysteine S-methyltransferase [Steroidobacteraceae bacterium]|nr:bifunctional helix-turn-helix domain-containing protein/methylated-DNA--[protein]-cysteine S-methyltransferase [Steroidobacteraceae bacterium]
MTTESTSELPLLNAADYTRIEQAIVYIHQHFREQPSLDTIASQVDLSSAHFNRLFSRWAGITPKQFVQRLTLDAAKQPLQEAHSVMRAALDAGLSGPGRLHDLFITLEALTPGEFKSGGAGLRFQYGVAESPFGICTLIWNERGLMQLDFVDCTPVDQRIDQLKSQWPAVAWQRDDEGAAKYMGDLWNWFQNPSHSIRVQVRGTNFQVQVWRALLKLGHTGFTHYGELATQLQQPGAARAIGNAVGANPIPWLIPCHRVLRANGGLGGYSGGLERKKVILAWEYARHGASQ